MVLAARMIQTDCQTLIDTAEDAGVTPDLIASRYMEVLVKLFSTDRKEMPLWKMLRMNGWDVDSITDSCFRTFLAEPSDGFRYLSQCELLALDRSPLDVDLLCELCSAVVAVSERSKSFRVHGVATLSGAEVLQQRTVTLFKAVDEKLQSLISKQASSLTLDLLRHLISQLSQILRTALLASDSLLHDMMPDECTDLFHNPQAHQEPTTMDLIEVIDSAWKVGILKKCIIQGRMESRITGVDMMQEILVEVWHRFVRTKADGTPHHIVVEYLAGFILKTKLVNYLVGVESHSQIIQRSKNIVGFLVVTHKYTEKETDVIWDSVLSSQDPRTIEAILEMVRGILDLSSHSILVYLCQKLVELPIRLFDNKMITYSNAVNSTLLRNWRYVVAEKMDLGPFDLMTRLLRESVSEPTLSLSRKKELWSFASHELRNLMIYRLDSEDKMTIYRRCFEDIGRSPALASGSITTLNVLLDSESSSEVSALGDTFDFATTVVRDLSSLPEIEQSSNVSFQQFPELLGERLRLTQKIILHVPDSLTPELTHQLWDCLVGKRALSTTTRDYAWSHLAKAVHDSGRNNKFCDICLKDLLPQLDPSYFTPSILEFANSLTEYEFRSTDLTRAEMEAEEMAVQGEIFWQISLTAPSQDIGARAITFLVKLNLDDTHSRGTGQASLAERHARLVERCIQQLIKAATKLKRLHDGTSSGEEDSMVIVASEKDVSAVKLCFIRSFAILKEFMRGIRSQQRDSHGQFPEASVEPNAINGQEVCIQYQPHVGGKSTGIFNLTIGDLSTLGDFIGALRSATGFSEFLMIACGQKIDQDGHRNTVIRDMKVLTTGLILIQKTPGAKSMDGTGLLKRLPPLEIEVMKHFGDLYDLLGIEDDLGCDVFNFLVTFPPHEGIVETVSSEDRPASEVFPAEVPYKTLYSVYALKWNLSQRLQEGASCTNLIQRGVRITSSALMDIALSESTAMTVMESLTTLSLVECLLRFLKEPVPHDTSATYFESPVKLVDRLMDLLSLYLDGKITEHADSLACSCFASILDASAHSRSVWDRFRTHPAAPALFRSLWLCNSKPTVRKATVAAVKSLCVALPPPEVFDAQDFIAFFWDRIVNLIPEAPAYHAHSEQFFEIALEILRRKEELSPDTLPLVSYLQDWSEVLLRFNHNEFVGRCSVNPLIAGLTPLIYWCVQSMKAKKKPLDIADDLIERLFSTHLFPTIPPRDDTTLERARIPVLNSDTRGSLYKLLLAVNTTLPRCRKLLNMAKGLLPESESSFAWSYGLAQMSDDFTYDCTWNFDRNKAIRSNTGYVGMKNLSNTCYLNSLFTQLYMNANFREFMLSTHLTDPEGSQKLLLETKKLFSYLQETWLKAVDPETVAASIVTYEDSPIDVSIQMDVDEFYNLLFDRWESQITSASDKRRFRQFYGGQIVQQIKSKDCPHVSERLEPFSAIQCEIQGKNSLIESLNAYVEGEVMEGDNKYSCSSCGSYVNAVKRACLKDIPDNLIFHLKRFDYDLMTGTRNKINDYFEFPSEVDMAPYNFDYLKDPGQAPSPDRFVLVGVLVHSGTAEAGHYYSYIRERPGRSSAWIEFNDSDVGYFDPQSLKDQCFGGWGDQVYTGMHYPKPWSAYMLFYQRLSSVEADQAKFAPVASNGPVTVNISTSIANRVNTENEFWIRKYCLFDPEHAVFTRQILDQYRNLSDNTCSDNHEMEKVIVQYILQHLEMVFCRQKDSFELHHILETLVRMVEQCSDCAQLILDGILSQETSLRGFLLRCPDELKRKRMALLIASASRSLRDRDPHVYGLDHDGHDSDSPRSGESNVGGAVQRLVASLKDLLPILHCHAKAWDDYYGLLVTLAHLGRSECELLCTAGFLNHILQILIIDTNRNFLKHWPVHTPYVKCLGKRRYSLRKMIELFSLLLRNAKVSDDTGSNSDDSHHSGMSGYILRQELDILRWTNEPNGDKSFSYLPYLEKVFRAEGVDIGVCQDIVRTLVRMDPDAGLLKGVYHTILQGTRIAPAVLARPYLKGASAFLESCPEPLYCRQLIVQFAREMQTIGNSGGEEHLEFFRSARIARNEAFSSLKPHFFHMEVLRQAPSIAPSLLLYPDVGVRAETVRFLHLLVFDHNINEMDDERYADLIAATAQQLLDESLKMIEKTIDQRKPIEVGRVDDLVKVVKHCLDTYCSFDEEDISSQSGQVQARAASKQNSAQEPLGEIKDTDLFLRAYRAALQHHGLQPR